jgi:hypothetical protein
MSDETTNLTQVALPTARSDSATLMETIGRIASDPSISVERMEQLVSLYERIKDRDAKSAYTQALALMQPELPVIEEHGGIKDRGGLVQSTYALWEDINEAIKPVLARHGFALNFRINQDGVQVIVTAVLSHKEGHSEETSLPLPLDTSGSKNAVQAYGSTVSYGQRYTARALLNLTSRGLDDDGKAGGSVFVTPSQIEAINALALAAKADLSAFCRYMRVSHIGEILARDYPRAEQALQKKLAEVKKRPPRKAEGGEELL